MNNEITIMITEDDEGHAALIMRNLKRSGISNEMIHFKDGQEVLDFLFDDSEESRMRKNKGYLLLLDIRMPKVDGVEVLQKIKNDPNLCKLPVIMITTTDDPREVERCHEYGCSNYITKPIDYDKFIDSIRKLGLFLKVVEVPQLNGD